MFIKFNRCYITEFRHLEDDDYHKSCWIRRRHTPFRDNMATNVPELYGFVNYSYGRETNCLTSSPPPFSGWAMGEARF